MSELTTITVAQFRETTEAVREAAQLSLDACKTLEEHAERLELIRDSKMYREDGYKSWAEYCKEGLGISKRHANRQIRAIETMKRLQVGPMGPTKPNERQARALSKAPPEDQAEVWSEVVEEHGDDVTAAKVAEAVDRRSEPKPPKAKTPKNGSPVIDAGTRRRWLDAFGVIQRALDDLKLRDDASETFMTRLHEAIKGA